MISFILLNIFYIHKSFGRVLTKPIAVATPMEEDCWSGVGNSSTFYCIPGPLTFMTIVITAVVH